MARVFKFEKVMLKQLSTTDYGLIGHPLEHSYSKAFFSELFAREGSAETYDNFDLPELTPEALYALVLLNPSLKGFNVTSPYKEAIIPFLDSLSPEAERVGAVNTVKVVRDPSGAVRRLEGFNTDVEGFRQSVAPMAAKLSHGAGALILGRGGAAMAVAEALRSLGVKSLMVSREKKETGIISYNDIDAALVAEYPLIINATPVGTYPSTDVLPPFPIGLLGPWNMVHDLVYNPAETKLMHMASLKGAQVKNGLEMLHAQALASLNIWKNQ